MDLSGTVTRRITTTVSTEPDHLSFQFNFSKDFYRRNLQIWFNIFKRSKIAVYLFVLNKEHGGPAYPILVF